MWSILLPQLPQDTSQHSEGTDRQTLTDRAMASRLCIHLWHIFPSKHMNLPYLLLITDFIVHLRGDTEVLL